MQCLQLLVGVGGCLVDVPEAVLRNDVNILSSPRRIHGNISETCSLGDGEESGEIWGAPELITSIPLPEAVDMNGRFQMQGGKNWILPK
jgi:hypothetical protein